jgi:signal transduction histidine kinase
LTFETKVLDKDGLPIDLLCSAVWSEEDQTAFCVLHDLRHQKMAERLQREVIEVACQELKNPIVAISDFHSGLSDGRFGQLKPGTQGKIESAKRCTGRMLTLVKDLEDCENLDRGKLHLEPVWSSLGDIFDRTMSAIADLAASGQVNLVAEPTALQIYADPARLLQILVNLSSNAVKFSPKQGTITLSAQALPGLVTIMVKDQGRGVPESMINSIFERFCQVRQSDSKAMGGSGLGLAICKSLVELHGGTIRVESGVNEGSIFSFTIPSPSRSAPPNITSGG